MSTTGLEGIEKLRRDVRAAAADLEGREARFLVDAYYQIQTHRIEAQGQVRALAAEEEPNAVLSWLFDQHYVLEREIAKALATYVDRQDAGRWATSIVGVGPILAAGLLAHIDIGRAPTVGHIWRFAGLDPTVAWEKGKKRPWNAALKTHCWKLGESFVKVSGRPCLPGAEGLESTVRVERAGTDGSAVPPERAAQAEGTDERERAAADQGERTSHAERADRQDGTDVGERAEIPEGAEARERAVKPERADRPERAVSRERTDKRERALLREGADIGERAVRSERTEADERAVIDEGTDLPERARCLPGCANYGHLYVHRKALEVARNEAGLFADQAKATLEARRIGKDTDAHRAYAAGKLPPARIHARAKRYAVKLFLAHFHHVLHEATFGAPPPRPYVIEHLGHVTYLAPPNWPLAE